MTEDEDTEYYDEEDESLSPMELFFKFQRMAIELGGRKGFRAIQASVSTGIGILMTETNEDDQPAFAYNVSDTSTKFNPNAKLPNLYQIEKKLHGEDVLPKLESEPIGSGGIKISVPGHLEMETTPQTAGIIVDKANDLRYEIAIQQGFECVSQITALMGKHEIIDPYTDLSDVALVQNVERAVKKDLAPARIALKLIKKAEREEKTLAEIRKEYEDDLKKRETDGKAASEE